MSHVQMSHVTYMNESCHTHETPGIFRRFVGALLFTPFEIELRPKDTPPWRRGLLAINVHDKEGVFQDVCDPLDPVDLDSEVRNSIRRILARFGGV